MGIEVGDEYVSPAFWWWWSIEIANNHPDHDVRKRSGLVTAVP
jgi:hypothetical protein